MKAMSADWWAGHVDALMAAGDQLAEQLRNPRSRPDSPWTQQILEEWAEAKDIAAWLPDAADQEPTGGEG